MRTALVMLTLVLCLGVLGISIYETLTFPEQQGNPVCKLTAWIARCFTQEKPLVILEEEVEVTKSIPRGVDMGCRSDSTLPEAKSAARQPEFLEEPTGTAEKFPERRKNDVFVEEPIILLEEEVEITKDIPRGTSFDQLSNRCLDKKPRPPVVEP
jgi:hypothetical protein